MMAFSGIVEPYRAANMLGADPAYEWIIISTEEPIVSASCGLDIRADAAINDAPEVDRIFVCSGGDAERYHAPKAWSLLRRLARRGAEIGAVADGAFFLARAGLLDSFLCAIHWESRNAFREAFPDIAVSSASYVIDGRRFTSAGGVAAFEMSLDLIARDHGPALAARVADWFMCERRPGRDISEVAPKEAGDGPADPVVAAAVRLMKTRLERPLKATEIAAVLDVSRDTLERRFRIATGRTPMAHYRQLRLGRARDLITRSSLSIGEIALACGFADPAHFAQVYRRAFGGSPRADRRHFLGARKQSTVVVNELRQTP